MKRRDGQQIHHFQNLPQKLDMGFLCYKIKCGTEKIHLFDIFEG